MATELVKATLNSAWADVAGIAASQLGVQWQNIGGLPIGLSFSTSAPGATDPYVTLAPGQTFQDNPGSAHVWAACLGGSSIVCATLNPASGGGGGGGAVTIADGADIAEGAKADASYTDTTGAASGSLVALHKGQYVLMAAMSAKLPSSLGAKTGATSLSVVPNTDTAFPVSGTFWQTTQPVSGTIAATQSGTWNINNIGGTISLPTGAATAANLTSQQTPLTPAAGTATVAVALGARYDLTVPTWTDTQQGALGVDTRGNLRVSLYSSGSSAGIVGLPDNADGVAVTTSTNRLATASRQYVYNGATWDRVTGNTSGQFAQGSGASGATAVGNPVGVGGIYKTTALTLTDGQRGDLLLGTRQALKVQTMLPDNVNNVGFQGAGSDAYANNAINAYNGFGFGLAFNGTTWDRVRSIAGAVADGTGLGVLAVEQAGALFNNISTATTTAVKSGKGILHKIVLNTYVASATITIYDNTAASGTKIGTITLPSTITGDTPITLPYDLQFSTGLTIVTSGATDITVIYR